MAGRAERSIVHRGRLEMLWTILVIIVIILAVIGFFSVVRGRA